MSRKLREKGPRFWSFLPSVRRRSRTQPSRNAIGELHIYQWLVFTSPTGVRIFFEALKEEKKDFRALAGLQIAVLGSVRRRPSKVMAFIRI
ncbi:MAG: uroporphyrinogen-III synthase [Lachnospiraceae bacterium]